MFVIVQVDTQRNQPVRVIPVRYTIEMEARAHAEVLSSRPSNPRRPLGYVVRPLDEAAPQPER